MAHRPPPPANLQQWIESVNELAEKASKWADSLGWTVARSPKVVREEAFGEYEVPFVRFRTPQGELQLDPIARVIVGGFGRVDLLSWPSHYRVKLVADESGEWAIYTDSNVRIRKPFNKATFAELAGDLTAPHAA